MITVELDPRLVRPPVKGIEYSNPDLELAPDYESVYATTIDLSDMEGGLGDPGTSTSLRPPEGVVIVSQVTRMSDTGQTVVDVLLEIMEMPGAAEYEVRMAVG